MQRTKWKNIISGHHWLPEQQKKHSFGIGQTVLKAVNLGNDSDTVGAICGQIAGAYYGVRNIPAEWPEVFYIRNEILDIASQLFRSKI